MVKDTRSFFERLTGAENIEEELEIEEKEDYDEKDYFKENKVIKEDEPQSRDEEGELAIDMYETYNDIFIKTVVSGVKPEDLDISITREKISIKGSRMPERGFEDANHHIKELYWGSFSRKVDLPEEINVDEAEAVAKHGLLVLKLPKINKERETKLRVKTG